MKVIIRTMITVIANNNHSRNNDEANSYKNDKVNYDSIRGNAVEITITLMIIISTTIMTGSVVTINTKL